MDSVVELARSYGKPYKLSVKAGIRTPEWVYTGIPHGGVHYWWGGAPAEEFRMNAASESLASAALVSQVHTSCVKVCEQVIEVSKNRRPKASA